LRWGQLPGANHLHGAEWILHAIVVAAAGLLIVRNAVAIAEHFDDDDRGTAIVHLGRHCRLLRRAIAFDVESAALMLGACIVGMPDNVPCTWMFAALRICIVAKLTLPETRMPASPASTVPRGAIGADNPNLSNVAISQKAKIKDIQNLLAPVVVL
jgi:hypothetical protein